MTSVYAYSATCTIKGNKVYYALTHFHNLPWTFIFIVFIFSRHKNKTDEEKDRLRNA